MGQQWSFVPHQPHGEGQEEEDNVGYIQGAYSAVGQDTRYTHTHVCGQPPKQEEKADT